MTEIYIKSFNRPFYLERCIRSIEHNVDGYSRIIVLDDGTESKYLSKLKERFPDVDFRHSGATDDKVELLRQGAFTTIHKQFPSAPDFWTTEVKKDTGKFVIIMEDDAWFVRKLELGRLLEAAELNNFAICKFWWSQELHNTIEEYRNSRGLVIEKFDPNDKKTTLLRSIWIVAFALFDRDYWLTCVQSAHRLADERSQLLTAQHYRIKHPEKSYAKMQNRTVFQGWVVPARTTPEYYDRGLRQHVYMDALNTAWATDQLDPLQGYPYDFTNQYIEDLLHHYVPQSSIDIWKDWRKNEVRFHYWT